MLGGLLTNYLAFSRSALIIGEILLTEVIVILCEACTGVPCWIYVEGSIADWSDSHKLGPLLQMLARKASPLRMNLCCMSIIS